jgi:magnesium transporter
VTDTGGARGIVDCAVYRDGLRIERDREVAGVRADAAAAGGFAWVGLVSPTAEEFESVRLEFDLHELAVEDAVGAHQRPKLEVYGETLFLVVKTVRYLGHEEVVEVGEVMLFVDRDFLITVRHGEAGGLGDVREELERAPELLRLGPSAALYAIVDRIVDGYEPVAVAVREDVDEVGNDVFSPGARNPVERIYKLHREVVEFSRATGPLRPALQALAAGSAPHVHPDLLPYFRDVADHVARLNEQVDGFGTLLAGILQANLTQVSVRQNEDMRRISAWVAILAVPTSVAGIYGMNFEHMPELGSRYGYPIVLLVILVACLVLFVRFRRAGWL